MYSPYKFTSRNGISNSRVSTRLCLLYVLLGFGACASPQGLAQHQLENINVTLAADLSDQFLSEVDLLFVYDLALLNQLPFSQFDWISSREQFLNASADQLDLIQLTITAEFQESQLTLPDRSRLAV